MRVRLSPSQKKKIKSTEDVYKIMQRVLMRDNKFGREREKFWVIGLDKQSMLLYIELIAVGRKNAVNIEPMDIYSLALTKKSSYIILCHNHPSGALFPSPEDVEFTRSIYEGGKLIRIKVLDHIIITEKKYFSFDEKGLMWAIEHGK